MRKASTTPRTLAIAPRTNTKLEHDDVAVRLRAFDRLNSDWGRCPSCNRWEGGRECANGRKELYNCRIRVQGLKRCEGPMKSRVES